jgi:hypothetical protein
MSLQAHPLHLNLREGVVEYLRHSQVRDC